MVEVNGYQIEPEASLYRADLSGANLTDAIMPDGTRHA